MKNNKKVKMLAIIIFGGLLLFQTYTILGDAIKEFVAEQKNIIEDRQAEKQVEKQKKEKLSAKAAEINVSENIRYNLQTQYGKKADTKINKLKLFLAEFDVENSFIGVIEKYISEGVELNDIMIAYDFIYENYGNVTQFEDFIGKRKNGSSWEDIFNDFNVNTDEFVNTNFDEKYLDYLFSYPNITTDDVVIADRLSQRKIGEFDELIKKRIDKKTWKEINKEIGILNKEEKMPVFDISEEDINEVAEACDCTEDEAVSAIVASKRKGISKKNIKNRIINKSNVQIEVDYLKAKYDE